MAPTHGRMVVDEAMSAPMAKPNTAPPMDRGSISFAP
jgi:hypothetical protein